MSGAAVVLLHGVWMPGSEMLFLKHRLATEHGFDCHVFSYASVRRALDENAGHLALFARDLGASRLHFVGHSLGGIMALRMLATHRDMPPGRVVCLGSPLCGSRAVEQLGTRKWGKTILGGSLPEGALVEPASEWTQELVRDRDVGIVAGSLSAGIGKLFASFEDENDGTVAVAETRLPGAKDHIVLRVSHTGLIMSRNVADQAAAFLRRGEFLRDR